MPIVTIQITREGTTQGSDAATAGEKAALIQGVSQLLLDVLKKPLESTFVASSSNGKASGTSAGG